VPIGPYFGLTSRDGDVGARAIMGFYF
jgi:hypothetical protein